MRRAALAVALLAAAWPAAARGEELRGSFELVGHDPLLARGMNSALALHGQHAYVGSRTDGTHPDAGILVVDLADPRRPRVVHQVGPPAAGNPGESQRELRVWPERDLLIAMSFECDPVGHACAGAQALDPPPTIRFFDLAGEHAARPRLLATYTPSRLPHEMFLWRDPARPGRALLYLSTPHEGEDNLLVADVSRARQGEVREVASWRAEVDERPEGDQALHSLSVSADGRRAYLAYLGAGFLVADTSELAEGRTGARIRLATPLERAVSWGQPGAHSAVPLFGARYALTTDEVYGRAFGLRREIGFDVLRGCPWGWARLIDVRDERRPALAAELRVPPYNDAAWCPQAPLQENEGASYSSHNPTLTRELALISWHSAGLQAFRIADPRRPERVAELRPEPLPAVATEDVALTAVPRAAMWSYPIVRDGLVHVVDIRNGLYVLRLRGPSADELSCVDFLEGNSNVGWPPPPCPVAIRGREARARGGAARVRLACRTRMPGGCRGRLVLEAAPRSRRAGRLRAGAAGYALPARSRATVRVPLTGAALRALVARRRLRVVATASTRGADGERRRNRARLALSAP